MSQIRVLFDAGGFQEPFGGVSLSFAQIIRNLSADIEPCFAVQRTCNVNLQASPFNIAACPDQYHRFITPGEFRGKWRLWQLAQRFLPRLYPNYEAANNALFCQRLEKGDFDILHLTAPHTYGNTWKRVVGKKPIVVTIHDLIPEVINHSERIAAGRREVLAAATRVIAVSENTKEDLKRLYGLPDNKIDVIHHGYSRNEVGAEGPSNPNGPILYVGKRGGYKNWSWMVSAIAPILKEGRRLVCTGLSFSPKEKRLLRQLGVADRVSQHYVAAADFPRLYASASVFIYPSLYEGFGLPILDSFAAGCPVVATKSSCFPEVAKDAAKYFEPEDAAGLCRSVRSMLSDSPERTGIVAKGFGRLKAFSWADASEKVASVYRECHFAHENN